MTCLSTDPVHTSVPFPPKRHAVLAGTQTRPIICLRSILLLKAKGCAVVYYIRRKHSELRGKARAVGGCQKDTKSYRKDIEDMRSLCDQAAIKHAQVYRDSFPVNGEYYPSELSTKSPRYFFFCEFESDVFSSNFPKMGVTQVPA